MTTRRSKALILAGDVVGNLGDHAIAMSVCHQLKAIKPELEIYIFGSNSKGQFFGDASIIPISLKGFFTLIAIAYKSRFIICGGGGLFQDDDSLIKMPYWSILLMLIRLLNPNLIGFSIGVGPLKGRTSRFFAKLAFLCLKKISVRDPEAHKLASHLVSKPVILVPDPAIALPDESDRVANQLFQEFGVPLDGTPVVGVAARRWYHHKRSIIPYRLTHRLGGANQRSSESFCQLISLLAAVLDKTVGELGAYIVFLPTYNVGHEGDDIICEAIKAKMKTDRACTIKVDNPRTYKSVTNSLSLMIGARMHPTILAAASSVPVIGLAYNQKFDGFFKLINNRSSLLWIDDFVSNNRTDDLYTLIRRNIGKDGDNYRSEIEQHAIEIQNYSHALLSENC